MSLMKDRARHLYSWRNDLTSKENEEIKKIVRQFRLEYVYEEIEELVMQELN